MRSIWYVGPQLFSTQGLLWVLQLFQCSSAEYDIISSKCVDIKNKGLLAKECHAIQQRATANHLLHHWNLANVFLSRGMYLGKLNLLPGTDATLIKKLASCLHRPLFSVANYVDSWKFRGNMKSMLGGAVMTMDIKKKFPLWAGCQELEETAQGSTWDSIPGGV